MIGVGDVLDLAELLARLADLPITAAIWQRFIRIVTVAETYFFRDLSQINALRYSVLPQLIEQRRADGQLELRLWSAGCSTGEEPYTLAILLRELIPDFSSWKITILATDLNLNHLERARNGVFRPWSFRAETPLGVRVTVGLPRRRRRIRWIAQFKRWSALRRSTLPATSILRLPTTRRKWTSFFAATS